MSKIRNLEQQWKTYRAKKIIKPILSISALYALGAGGYYAFLKRDFIISSMVSNKETLVKPTPVVSIVEKNITKNEVVEKDINSSIDKKIVVKEEPIKTVEEMLLKPVIPIIDMDIEKRAIVHHHKAKKESTLVQARPSKLLTAKELSKIKIVDNNTNVRDTTRLKRIHLHTTSKNYIETIKRKFYKSKSSRDALLLAEAFYREHHYRESEKWALEANRLNSNLDESWIIFAESKARLGRRDEAINILAMYYKKSKSAKARAVIEKIKRGKL